MSLNCRVKLKQQIFWINNIKYIGVIIPHEGAQFSLSRNGLNYAIFDGSVMTDKHIIIPAISENETYEVLGEYKTLEKDHFFYRDTLINVGFNIDENIIIIKRL